MRPNGSQHCREQKSISAAEAREKCFNCTTPLAAWPRDDVGCCTRKYCTACCARYVRGQVKDAQYPVECPAVHCAEPLKEWKTVAFLCEQGLRKVAYVQKPPPDDESLSDDSSDSDISW